MNPIVPQDWPATGLAIAPPELLTSWLSAVNKDGVPSDVGKRYGTLAQYEALLKYISECPKDRAFLVYDAFAILGKKQKDGTALRGFYIDLWDTWIRVGQPGATHGVVPTVLRSFLATMAPSLSPVLDCANLSPNIHGLDRWHQELDKLIHNAHKDGVTDPKHYKHYWRLFRALAHLYGTVFPDDLRRVGLAALNSQLAAANKQRNGQWEQIASPAVQNDVRAIAAVLALLVAQMSFPFDNDKLDAVLKRVDSRQDDLSRLLKHWGTSSLFVKLVLEDLGFRYMETCAWKPAALPAPRGCDLFVSMIGTRSVGKTHFMFATEAALASSDKINFEVFSLLVDGLDNLRDVWKNARRALSEQERDEKGFVTDNAHATGRTGSKYMTRLQFMDIPGEIVENDQQRVWLEKYLINQQPRALLLLVDEEFAAKAETYLKAINLFKATVKAPVPVYVVLNKSDLALERVESPELREELRQYIDAERPFMSDQMPFLSSRGLNPAKIGHDEIRRFVLDSDCGCKSLVFQEHLLRDLERLRPVVDAMYRLEDGTVLGDVTFVYTTSLNLDLEKRRNPFKLLWENMVEVIAKSTEKERSEWFRQRFLNIDESGKEWLEEFRGIVDKCPAPELNIKEIERICGNADTNDWEAVMHACAGRLNVSWPEIEKSIKSVAEAELESGFEIFGYKFPLTIINEYLADCMNARNKLISWAREVLQMSLSALGIDHEMPRDRNILSDSFSYKMRDEQQTIFLNKFRTARHDLASPEIKQDVENDIRGVLDRHAAKFVDQQLDRALQAFFAAFGELQQTPGIDIPIEYHKRLGALETGCPFVDRPRHESETRLISRLQGQYLEQALVTWAAGSEGIEGIKPLLKLLTNLEPVRSLSEPATLAYFQPGHQFLCWRIFEVDETKRKVLAEERLRRLNSSSIDAASKAALQVLELIRELEHKFGDKYFTAARKITASRASGFLVKLMEIAGFKVSNIDITRFEDRLKSAYALVCEIQNSLWQNTKRDRLNEIMTEIEHNWMCPEDLRSTQQRLAAASAIVIELKRLKGEVNPDIQWTDFAQPMVTEELKENLRLFLRDRESLLLLEQISYLDHSGWMKGDARLFLDKALDAYQAADRKFDELSKGFREAIEGLLKNEGLWAP